MAKNKTLSYAYYPGCAAKQIQKEADWSARAVAEKLGMRLRDMPDATCCGAGNLQEHDPAAGLAINARIFSQAEEMGADIVTICNTCLQTFTLANERLKNDPELLANINNVLRKAGVKPYKGTIDIKHFIWALVDDVGLEKVKKQVVSPLNGMNIAPFYGCHIMRPLDSFEGRGGEKPQYLEQLIGAIGGKSVDYNGKDKCCGFHTMLIREDAFLQMSGGHSLEAKQKGADIMVSPCTLCDMAMGAYQSRAEKKLKVKIDLPEMNITQLVGMAFGCDIKELGVDRLHQNPLQAMQEYGVKIA